MSLLLILLVLVLVPLLGRQMHVVAAKVPLAIDWFKLSLLPWLEGQFNVGAGDIPLEKIKQALMANWQSAGAWRRGCWYPRPRPRWYCSAGSRTWC